MTNSSKIILDLCGGTGAWSEPYRKAGYDVRLITLPEYDVRIYNPPDNVYGILAAPPCTMFSFARTNAKIPRNLEKGMEVVIACLKIIWQCQYRYKNEHQKLPPLKFWALENPFSMLNWFLGHPVLIFHPYEYGDGYSKKTALWGYFNPPKKLELWTKKFDALQMQELKEKRSIGDLIWKDVANRQVLRSITPPRFALAFYEANK